MTGRRGLVRYLRRRPVAEAPTAEPERRSARVARVRQRVRCPLCEGIGELDLAIPAVLRGGRSAPGLTEEAHLQQTRELLAWLGYFSYHTRRSTGSDPGFPDLLAYRPAGRTRQARLVGLELKLHGAAPTEDQRRWLQALAEGARSESFLLYPEAGQELLDELARDAPGEVG